MTTEVIRTQIYQVGLKVETTEGTKIALVAGDFITAHQPSFSPNVDMAEDESAVGTMSKSANTPGLRSGKITFKAYLRGGAAAGTAPELSVALKACGLKETIVASTSVTYTPAPQTTTIPSVTVELREDGKITRIWGARGKVTKRLQIGKLIELTFEFTGCDFEKIDGALMTGVTPTPIAPILFQAATVTLAAVGTYLNLNAIDLDDGNEVTLIDSSNASSGYSSAVITDRDHTLSFDPNDVLAAHLDFYATWKAGTTAALSIGPLGSGAGKICTITAPAVQYQSVSESERNKARTLSIKSRLCKSSGDDELSIAFT